MTSFFATIGTGVLTGLIFYLNKATRYKEERFDILKISRTTIISIAVALAAYLAGYKLTAANYEVFIAANAGVIMLAERLVMLAYRAVVVAVPMRYAIIAAVLLFGVGGISYAAPTQQRTALTWDAPTTNADGSALSDLKGFYIYWSATSGDFTDARRFSISDPTDTDVRFDEITGLGDTTGLYFAVTAYDASGNESDYSNEVQIVPFVVPGAPGNLRIE